MTKNLHSMTDEEIEIAMTDALGDEYDALEDEQSRRAEERESRAAARDYAAWKGQHNARLHRGSC
jgi:hypothetical protein